jgi:hypothetical protein
MRINLCLLTEKRKAAMAASLLRLRDYNGLILFRSLLAGIMMAIIHRAGIEGRNRRHSMLKDADGRRFLMLIYRMITLNVKVA